MFIQEPESEINIHTPGWKTLVQKNRILNMYISVSLSYYLMQNSVSGREYCPWTETHIFFNLHSKRN